MPLLIRKTYILVNRDLLLHAIEEGGNRTGLERLVSRTRAVAAVERRPERYAA
jgi:hypothetical protein